MDGALAHYATSYLSKQLLVNTVQYIAEIGNNVTFTFTFTTVTVAMVTFTVDTVSFPVAAFTFTVATFTLTVATVRVNFAQFSSVLFSVPLLVKQVYS